MNLIIIGLGLLAALFLLVRMVKSRRRYKTEEIDWEAHNMQMAQENSDLRVTVGDRSYLNKRINQEAFLHQYRDAWNRVRLNFEPATIGKETILFSPAERLKLRQRIALSWIYVYNVNNRQFKFLFWSMGSEGRRDVLKAAEEKYGAKSEKAIALAAHTLNLSTERFKAWMKSDEEFLSKW